MQIKKLALTNEAKKSNIAFALKLFEGDGWRLSLDD
jgi:hypothetical protein